MMRGRSASAGALLLALAVALPAPAWAQYDDAGESPAPAPDVSAPPTDDAASTPSAEDDRKARELFRQADEHYKNGRYEAALGELREAHRLSGREVLRFNIANALEKLRRYQEALDELEAYAPHASEARKEAVATRIAELKERLAAAAPAPEPPPPSPEPAAPDVLPPAPVPTATTAPAREPVAPAPAPPASGDDGRGPTAGAIAGYALLGAGVLGLGLGAVFGAVALGARSDAEAACDSAAGRCLRDAADPIDDDENFALAADVSFAVGAVCALAGGALVIHSFVSEPASSKSAGRSLSLSVSSNRLSVGGTF
jgi:tetratricopeptide (TPR) repeat protein